MGKEFNLVSFRLFHPLPDIEQCSLGSLRLLLFMLLGRHNPEMYGVAGRTTKFL